MTQEPRSYIVSTHEVKHQFIDRMLNYTQKACEQEKYAHAYSRLVHESIGTINPVSDITISYVNGLICSSQIRFIEGDYYNARTLLENAISIMIKGD